MDTSKSKNTLKKQLLAAIAMVIVAMLALGTSTYAWFSMNTSVTADGMSVKAKTSGGLAIGAYTNSSGTAVAPAASTFASTASAIFNANATIFPTSTPDAKDWYQAEAQNANSYEAKSNPTKISESDLGKYRLISKFQVKSLDTATDQTNTSLYVTSITVTKTTANKYSDALDKAVRVCIVVDSTPYFFAPLYTDSATLYYWNGTQRVAYGSSGAKTIVLNTSDKKDKLNVQLSSSLSTAAKDVDVYTYYEGEDGNCMSINAVNISELNVSINFSTQAATTN